MGSAGIGASTGLRGPLALLEAAFDAGIRHFDTAPLYGMGNAEHCLGEFLLRHKNEITITTKYGLKPPQIGMLKKLARNIARPLLSSAPGLKKKLLKAAASSNNEVEPVYTVEAAQASLENSLRELKTERIHIWLLHEATAASLHDEKLLRFMEDTVRQGKIGAFGVGGASAKMTDIYATRRAHCPVMQCEWDLLEGEDRYAGTFKSRFQVFRYWPAKISEYLKVHPAIAQEWSNEVGVDLLAPGNVSALTLRAALLSNPGGLIAFESRKVSNIARNAASATDPSLSGPDARFLALLRREEPRVSRQ